jgi:hypothetical protein
MQTSSDHQSSSIVDVLSTIRLGVHYSIIFRRYKRRLFSRIILTKSLGLEIPASPFLSHPSWVSALLQLHVYIVFRSLRFYGSCLPHLTPGPVNLILTVS